MFYELVLRMPNLYQRKILRTGDSLVVALPPAWLRYYNLKEGDTVELISNDEVVVKVVKKRE